MTYLQEYHNTSQAMMGRKGRKNWLVTGNMSEVMSAVAMTVFSIGPGSCMMLRQKMPSTASPKYWKSYRLHWCLCSAFIVSDGEKLVCNANTLLAGL